MIQVKSSPFGELPDGGQVLRYTLENEKGAQVRIMELGATVTEVQVPDRNGNLDGVALSFPSLQDYLTKNPYPGSICGRVGNRLENAEFTLNGETYSLTANDGRNQCHGGTVGFNRRLWKSAPNGNGVIFTYFSPDGEEHYPGNLSVCVRYGWSEDCVLSIDYEARSDRDTVCNLTNHTYWSLGGYGGADPLRQNLQIEADYMTPINREVLPTGEIVRVSGAMDLRRPQPIADGIAAGGEQIAMVGGYDHNFVLRRREAGDMALAAVLSDEASGRRMEVATTMPGLQFYSGFILDGKHSGIALETQNFPNAMRYAWFPSIVLRAGETAHSRTEYRFSTKLPEK